MNEVVLDIQSVNNVEELHRYLKGAFGFPFYYGENLDALYDCLTDIAEPTAITLPTEEALWEKLGNYGRLTFKVFMKSSDENNNLILKSVCH